MQYVYIGWLCQALSWPSRTNYSNGSGGAIPSPKLAIQQPFYACLCLTMPILRYDWNSGFHTPAPATCSFAESTCLFYPRRYVGRSKMHMSSQIVHITSAKKQIMKIQSCQKKVSSLTKVPSSQLFCSKRSQNSSHLSGRSVCSILNESWQKLSFLRSIAVLSRDLRQAHCATTSLTILVYLSTVHYFAHSMQFCQSHTNAPSKHEEASGYFYGRSLVLYICRMRLLFRDQNKVFKAVWFHFTAAVGF